MEGAVAEPADAVQSIERSARVIAAIARGDGGGVRAVDVVTRTGLHKTTVHRILATLEGLGWVEHDELGQYRIGLELVALGLASASRRGLVELAGPHLSRLAEETGDTVYLQVRMGGEALCLDRVTGSFPIRALTLGIGDRRPLGAGAGSLALLAWSPDREVSHAIAATIQSRYEHFRSPEAIGQMVAGARAAGYAHNPGLIVPGAEGVGVPVLDHDGYAVAAISIAAISSRFAGGRLTQLAALLQEEARLLAQRLQDVQPGLTASAVRGLLRDPGQSADGGRWAGAVR
jgi:DNA-binding IclR family transcriptional regulator